MSLAVDTSEYISLMESKLASGLPEEKNEVLANIKKLKDRLIEIEKEESDIRLELEYLKIGKDEAKSVFDIPLAAWTKILNFAGNKNDLHHASLASQDLKEKIIGSSCEKKMGLIGEKVFWILSGNFYLTGDDLLNCLESGDENLQQFSGATLLRRCMMRRKLSGRMGITTTVHFSNVESIRQFYTTLSTEQNKNEWDIFRDKEFFVYATDIVGTSEKTEFWKALNEFMSRFGKYIGNITFRGMAPIWLNKNLVQNFPRLRELSWNINTVSSIINRRTCEPNYSLRNEFGSENDFVPFLHLFGQDCHRWHVNHHALKFVCQRELSTLSENLKELTFNIPHRNQRVGYKIFVNADFSNFRNVEKIFFNGTTDHLRSLRLAPKFPNLKEITLDGAQGEAATDVEPLQPGPGAVFPTVKKLTIGFSAIPPPPLELFSRFFPCLTVLTLRHCLEKDHLFRVLGNWISSGLLAGHAIDVLRLIEERRSLVESNIWRWPTFPMLKRLTIMSVLKFRKWAAVPEDRGVTEVNKICANWVEVYTRTQNGSITLQKFVSPYFSDYL